MRRPRRGQRFLLESRYSLSVQAGRSLRGPQQRELRASAGGGFGPSGSSNRKSLVQNPAKSSVQIPAPLSAQRGGKTGYGFPARGIVAAQSTAQFSAPCPPHCGSACAPPPSRRPLGFHLDFTDAKRVKSLFTRAGDGGFVEVEVFRAPARFILFRLPPK